MLRIMVLMLPDRDREFLDPVRGLVDRTCGRLAAPFYSMQDGEAARVRWTAVPPAESRAVAVVDVVRELVN